ncbi:hypothetical protein GQX74_015048 [Glossina fuscipes]|nr:hypothetical protein GQX74_015048 [Glossina fuscipes]
MPPKNNAVMKTGYKSTSSGQSNTRDLQSSAKSIMKSMPANKGTAKVTVTEHVTTTQTRKIIAKVELPYKK